MPGPFPPERPPSDAVAEAPTVAVAQSEDSLLDAERQRLIDSFGPPSDRSAVKAASLIGTLLSDRYLIHELVGQGGMGAVYRGEQIHLHKRVAIKVLHPDAKRSPDLVARFKREAVAGAHVQHSNVAAAIDFGQLDDDGFFLVLEYVEGQRLSDALAKGALEIGRALRIARQMAEALEAVHAKGIVHRDIKPDNTLLEPGDRVKIIDFGLARVDLSEFPGASRGESRKPLTASGVVFGTPGYMAPEASLGMGAVDARSDLYALGVVTYEMLAGSRPFTGASAASIFRHQRLDHAPPFATQKPLATVPPEVEAVVFRLLAQRVQDRFQSAQEVVVAIDEALRAWATRRDSPPASPQPAQATNLPEPRALLGSSKEVPVPRRRRLPWWGMPAAAIGSLVFGSLAVLVTGTLLRWGSAPAPARSTPTPDNTSQRPRPPAPGADASAPAATAAPPTPTSQRPVPPTQIEGVDAAGYHAHLEKAVSIKDWALGARAVAALARLEPTFLDDQGARERVVAVAAGVAHDGTSELSDAVFNALSSDLGASGLDLLYELALSRGGTRGGQRARAILSLPPAHERTTPALRVAFDFYVGSCATRQSLLDRAGAVGDRRVLVQLEVAHSGECTPRANGCCFHDDPRLATAMARIRERIDR